MKLPYWITALGYIGLVPFLAEPLWLTLAAEPSPWLDQLWLGYVTLMAAFLAGTFLGFALVAIEGPAGKLGVLIASALLALTAVAMSFPFRPSLYVLAVVFLLLLLADFWRERTLDTIPGYFRLRTVLTTGTLVAIAWRLALPQ